MNPSKGALYFLHDDMLGTPQLATDASKVVAWRASYQPFGVASVSGIVTQNLRFPGQYFDIESGWNHNGFRNYISDLGRYAEPDPLAMLGSARLYSPSVGSFAGVDTPGLSGEAALMATRLTVQTIGSIHSASVPARSKALGSAQGGTQSWISTQPRGGELASFQMVENGEASSTETQMERTHIRFPSLVDLLVLVSTLSIRFQQGPRRRGGITPTVHMTPT
jgi:RHS repeat-associated protein